MTTTLERAREKVAQLALCLLVGILSGGILLLDVTDKWKTVLVAALGAIVFMLVSGRPKRILLLLIAFTAPFYLGKAFVARLEHPGLTRGVSANLSDILALALLFVLLGRLGRHRARISSIPLITVPAVAWLIASSFSLFAARDVQLAVFQFINLGKLLLLYWVTANCVGDERDVQWLVGGMILGMLCQAVLGVCQGVTGHPLGLGFLGEVSGISQQELSVGRVFRVQGTTGHPNSFAMYLSTGVPFVLASFSTSMRRSVRVLAIITLCLISMALVFSLSRAAWVNFLVTICLVLVLAVRRRRVSLKAAIMFACVTALALLAVALYGTDIIRSRLIGSDRGSAYSRITLARGALAVLRDYPLVGVGLNNYPLVSPQYDPVNLVTWGYRAPMVHNAFLLIAAETGLVGLVTFVVFQTILLIHAWRIVDRASGDTVWVASVGILGALVALVSHGMVDYALLGSSQVFTQFWLLAGLTAALVQRANNEKPSASRDVSSLNTIACDLRSCEKVIQAEWLKD